MIPLSLQEIANALDATLLGEDRLIEAVTTDSRQIAPGALFVAIKGERFDAHHFCAEVVANGAGALLVSEPQPLACPQLLVNDTVMRWANSGRSFVPVCNPRWWQSRVAVARPRSKRCVPRFSVCAARCWQRKVT